MRIDKRLLVAAICLQPLWFFPTSLLAQDFDRPPIRYSESTPHNTISKLQTRLDSGKQQLAYDQNHGYLKSLLQALDVPVDSQMLVFSKSSVQARYISPATPRAIYFNDDVYVGFCVSGNVLEISAVDPELGTVFYTLDQKPSHQPSFTRHGETCLNCHSAARIGGIPGHIVRSHIADEDGHVIPSAGIHPVDYTTPLEQRWGGWYVTGTSGEQHHLGNFLVHGYNVPDQIDNSAGENVVNLADRFDVTRYLAPDSDIVALMVFEHQTQMHNRLTSANFATRQALYLETQMRQRAEQGDDQHLPITVRAIERAGDDVLDALLLVGEAQLTDAIAGTSGFAQSFAQRGPRDSQGRSLRELDLKRRLFRYPCSYLIYSESFQKLPREVHDYVWQRLSELLTAEQPPARFSHLSDTDRQDILAILRDTIPDLPAAFDNK